MLDTRVRDPASTCRFLSMGQVDRSANECECVIERNGSMIAERNVRQFSLFLANCCADPDVEAAVGGGAQLEHKEHTMTKIHWFIEQEEGWQDGCFVRVTTHTPIEPQEAALIRQALELKELARAQQKLLQPYRNQVVNTRGSAQVPIRSIFGDDD